MIMKTYFKHIMLGLLLSFSIVSCEDNENWRIIPYEPVETPIEGPQQLYVVGAHQGWAPSAEVIGKLYPIDSEGNYAGYAYLNGEYKCTSQQNWDGPNYGAGSGEGTLSTAEDAGNLTAEEGYYYLNFNINDLTYTAQLVNFGVIGDATPGGWDEDTDLTYDPTDLKLKVDITLTDGNIKFRANDSWDVPNGDFGMGENDGELLPKGSDIPVTAGDYQIVVDLSTPDYNYTMVSK